MGEKCPDYRDVLISGMGKCTNVPFGTVIILNCVLPFRRGGLPQGKVPVVIPILALALTLTVFKTVNYVQRTVAVLNMIGSLMNAIRRRNI